MRRQYHTLEHNGHSMVWDVHRLIALAERIPVVEVALADIRELDEAFWFADGEQATCRAVAVHAKLIDETDLEHPVLLAPDGRVMDGMHRVCKALNLGHATVKAKQFEQWPEPDHVDVDLADLPYDEPGAS